MTLSFGYNYIVSLLIVLCRLIFSKLLKGSAKLFWMLKEVKLLRLDLTIDLRLLILLFPKDIYFNCGALRYEMN